MSSPSDFSAFIFAAGEGRRLRPYTDTLPKPMVPVAGRPLLGHILDHLADAGVGRATINTFHKGEVIEEYVAGRTDIKITLSKENALLNTGLGAKRALDSMGGTPFFAINGDAFWQDGNGGGVFERLCAAWQPEEMDILLLLQPVQKMTLTQGVGDYTLEAAERGMGRAVRKHDQSGEYMFAGIRICDPKIFADTPEAPFSFLELMDKAERRGRLFGLVHEGAWHHISTPGDLERVNDALASGAQNKALCSG